MLTGRAIYIWQLTTILTPQTIDDAVARAVRAKLSSVWVKIGDGSRPFANIRGATADLFRGFIDRCNAAGLVVLGYHVPRCATEQAAHDEVAFVAQTVEGFDLAGVVVDNEDGPSYFKGTEATAALYAQLLKQAMSAAGRLMVMSSNDIISAHPKSYARTIGAEVDVNAPQVYYGQSKSIPSRFEWAERENAVLGKPFFPVGAAFMQKPKSREGGFVDPVACANGAREFIQLVSALNADRPDGCPGYGFWNWDESPEQFWDVLYDTPVFVTAAMAAAAPPAPPPAVAAVAAAAGSLGSPAALPSSGWVLSVRRIRTELRHGEGFARTVGSYAVLHDGVVQDALMGTTVERQGPGDNSLTGKREHRCIAAGTYPLASHASAKYRTTGYQVDGSHPRPALELLDTGDRSEILVHPADRYGSTIGCINLSGPLANAESDLVLPDSIARVVAVIEDLRRFSGGRLQLGEDGRISNAKVVIADIAAPGPASADAPVFVATALAAETDCLIYEQASGRMLVRESGTFDTIGVGYSGSESRGGKNDPSKQCVRGIGPIPRGRYTIGPPIHGPSPYSLRLTPDPANDMCGRSGFLIHGDSIAHPGDASDGCIILTRPEREAIVKTGLTLLIVVEAVSD
jgi:type VI secretion system (T6SS) effector TldE1-like protein